MHISSQLESFYAKRTIFKFDKIKLDIDTYGKLYDESIETIIVCLNVGTIVYKLFKYAIFIKTCCFQLFLRVLLPFSSETYYFRFTAKHTISHVISLATKLYVLFKTSDFQNHFCSRIIFYLFNCYTITSEFNLCH